MLRGRKYEPHGMVSRHPYIKFASSISDLISKVIEIELGDFSRVQVKPEAFPLAAATQHEFAIAATAEVIKEAKAYGIKLYHATCHECSSFRMIQNGTCKVCLDCGSTTGCS